MDKVLVICGPTATGKTKLALYLAEKLNGEVISADSRQVYKYFDIVTGKDLPSRFKFEKDHFSDGEVSVWGYDIVSPSEDFSAKLYSDYAREKISQILSRGKLPIIEGGTGFYIDAALKNLANISVPRNEKLRNKYDGLSAEKLFRIYMNVDPIKAITLNESDRKNSRRMTRLLEIADFELRGYRLEKSNKKELFNTLWVGLNYSTRAELNEKIEKRVDDRLGFGLEKEVSFLKEKGYFKKASETTPGYQYWDNPEKWKLAERNYAKRQITWFKRYKNIKWFDPSETESQIKVEELVSKWYSNSDDQQN